MWTLFISICTSVGMCAWFEVNNPEHYKTEKQCVQSGNVIVEKTVRETQTHHGNAVCVESRYANEYRIWLQNQ